MTVLLAAYWERRFRGAPQNRSVRVGPDTG